MRHTVEFEYEIGEHVVILALSIAARVDSLSFDNNGPMYRVIYWKNRERSQQWLYPWEVQSPIGPDVGCNDTVGHYV